MTDAIWQVNGLQLHAMNTTEVNRSQGDIHGYNGANFVYTAPALMYLPDGSHSMQLKLNITVSPPITLSTQRGATTQITKIDLSSYKAVYESYAGESGYWDKTNYPYLYGTLVLHWQSQTLDRLLWKSDHSADSKIFIHFQIAR